MKKFFYVVWLMIGISLLPSCRGESKADRDAQRQDSINAVLQDSINTANAEKDSLLQLMNDIANGMNQIKQMEDIVSVNNLSEETPDRKKQLKNDLLAIQQTINNAKAQPQCEKCQEKAAEVVAPVVEQQEKVGKWKILRFSV